MTLDNLVSKVLAAGLAAGVFLLWWPAHLPSDGAQWLVLRGLAWTLAFELLVVAFAPVERMAAGTLARRRAAAGARRMRTALAAAPTAARKSGAVVMAVTGLAVPAVMLAQAGHLPSSKPVAKRETVVRKVIVRRQVVKRDTVIVRAPAAPAATYAASAPRKQAPATTSATKKTTTAPEPKPDPVVQTTTGQAAPKTTTTAPADAVATPQPADTAAAPAADATADPAAG
jgi:hypothetical protein